MRISINGKYLYGDDDDFYYPCLTFNLLTPTLVFNKKSYNYGEEYNDTSLDVPICIRYHFTEGFRMFTIAFIFGISIGYQWSY